MTVYKNVGVQFRRSNGQLVARDGVFTPTPKEERSMKLRRQIPIRFIEVNDQPGIAASVAATEAPDKQKAADVAAAVKPEDRPVILWTAHITPEQYLERFPNGPQAALARVHAQYNASAPKL